MANKKKTETEETTSTTKKGVTKVNTTRTQKIAEKTKAVKKATATKPKATTAKKTTGAKATTKKTSTKTTAKKSATKKTTTKKTATKKATGSKSAAKKTTTKKTTTTKTTTKKVANNDITSKTVLVKEFASSEYYDLPFSYNQTVVKILAQTPETLFVYWDISEDDRKKYVEQYGENFFNETKPVLIITNTTMGYTFEVEINDFANSWYLHIKDAKCQYNIELGRRPISHNVQLPNDYLYVAASNVIEMPNDRILFEKAQNMVYYKNVKTNEITQKPVTSLSFLQNMGKIYNIYDVYHKIYKDEKFEDATKLMGNSSSVFK